MSSSFMKTTVKIPSIWQEEAGLVYVGRSVTFPVWFGSILDVNPDGKLHSRGTKCRWSDCEAEGKMVVRGHHDSPFFLLLFRKLDILARDAAHSVLPLSWLWGWTMQ